jgi:hypothetical protein
MGWDGMGWDGMGGIAAVEGGGNKGTVAVEGGKWGEQKDRNHYSFASLRSLREE